MGCCTFANESRFLFEIFPPLFQTRKKGERRASGVEGGSCHLFSFLLSLIPRRISYAVHRKEVPSPCRASPGSHSAFLQPSRAKHTRTRAVDHSHAQKKPAFLTAHAARRSAANDASKLSDLSHRNNALHI